MALSFITFCFNVLTDMIYPSYHLEASPNPRRGNLGRILPSVPSPILRAPVLPQGNPPTHNVRRLPCSSDPAPPPHPHIPFFTHSYPQDAYAVAEWVERRSEYQGWEYRGGGEGKGGDREARRGEKEG